MPVFLAGASAGRILAAFHRIPLYPVSHQEGHIRAALGNLTLGDEPFIAVHFSGGTSEVLLVESWGAGYQIATLLETTDLNAGQLVDRVGVAMGLPFPAGAYLEKLAREQETDEFIPAVVTETDFSFSGAETRALDLLKKGVAPPLVAHLVLRCVSNTLEKALRQAVEKTGRRTILLAGGVMANRQIRERLEKRLAGAELALHWAEVRLASDNAVGVAQLACQRHQLEYEVLQ